MPEGERRLASALERLLATKQDRPQVYPGLMGAYVAGVASVKVSGRPDFVWVRLRGVQSEPIMAFNDKVAEHFDLPVLVYREPENPHLWRVYGRDVSKYQSWGGASYLPPHGRTHSLSGDEGAGSDIVWVQKGQFLPMLPHPQNSGSMSIYIEPEAYLWDGEYRYFPGTGTQSFQPRKPTGAFTSRFVTVYLRGSDGTLQYLNGDEYPATFPPNDIWSFIAVPEPDEGFPIAAVNLFSGTQRLGWREVYDLRFLPGPLVGTGSSLGLLDEGIPLGLVDELEFVGAGVTATVSGSRGRVNIPGGAGGSGSVQVRDEAAPLGSAEILDFVGAGVTATISGAYVSIDIPGGGGAGGSGSVQVWDEHVPLGSAQILDFVGAAVAVKHSGSYAEVTITVAGGGEETATYLLAAIAEPLDPPDNQYWRVPVYPYATGSLSVMLNGVWQKPGDDFSEQYPDSGTFSLASVPPTGTVSAVAYGVPVAPFGHATGTMVVYDEDQFLGVFEEIRFKGAGVDAYNSGSYVAVRIPGGGDGAGVDQIGVYGLDNGVPLGTGTQLDAGYGLDLTLSGTRLQVTVEPPVTGSVVVADEGTVLGSVPVLNFRGAGVTAEVSGSYADIHIPGGGGDGGGGLGIFALDDGVPLGTGTSIDFGDNLTATLSGTRIRVDAQTGAGGGPTGTVVIADDDAVLGLASVLEVQGQYAHAGLTGSRAWLFGQYISDRVPFVSGSPHNVEFEGGLLPTWTATGSTAPNLPPYDVDSSWPSHLHVTLSGTQEFRLWTTEPVGYFETASGSASVTACFIVTLGHVSADGVQLELSNLGSGAGNNSIRSLYLLAGSANPEHRMDKTVAGSNTFNIGLRNVGFHTRVYLHLERIGTNQWAAAMSQDGLGWVPISVIHTQAFTDLRYIGVRMFKVNSLTGARYPFGVDWIRVNHMFLLS